MDLGLLFLYRLVDLRCFSRLQPQFQHLAHDNIPVWNSAARYQEARRYARCVKGLQRAVLRPTSWFGGDFFRPDFPNNRPNGSNVGALYADRSFLHLIHKRRNLVPVSAANDSNNHKVHNTNVQRIQVKQKDLLLESRGVRAVPLWHNLH